jgi:hypothetical protein
LGWVWRLFSLSVLVALWTTQAALAQAVIPCVNDALGPYRQGVSFVPLPDASGWGSTAGVAVAPDGTIWAL